MDRELLSHSDSDEWTFLEEDDQYLEEVDLLYDNDVFVFDIKEISRDVIKLLTVDAKDAKSIAPASNAIVQMFVRLFGPQSLLEASIKNSQIEFPKHALPVFTAQKHVMVEPVKDGKLVDNMIYTFNENSIEENIAKFVRAFQSYKRDVFSYARLQNLFTLYDAKSNNNETLSQSRRDIDAVYTWVNTVGVNVFERTRLLKEESQSIVGIAFSLASSTNTKGEVKTFDLSEYESFVNSLKEKDAVRVEVNQFFPGLPHTFTATISRVDKHSITLKANIEVENKEMIFKKGSLARILSNHISIKAPGSSKAFSKYKMLSSNCIVLHKSPDGELVPLSKKVLESLLPSAAEVLYTDANSNSIYSLDDLKGKFPANLLSSFDDYEAFKNIVARNLDKLPAVKKPKRVTKLFKKQKKLGSKFLSGVKYPYPGEYIDDQYGRLHFLNDTNSITKALIACIQQEDLNKVDLPSLKSVKLSKSLKSKTLSFDEFQQALEKQGKVFKSLPEAFADNPTTLQDKAHILNVNSGHYYALIPMEFQSKYYWLASPQETIKSVKSYGYAYNLSTHCLVKSNTASDEWNKHLQDRAKDIEKQDEQSNPVFLDELLYKLQNPNNDKVLKKGRKELEYAKPVFEVFEGDEDFADVELLYNNKEFGVDYQAVEEDVDSGDELDDVRNDTIGTEVSDNVKQFLRQAFQALNVSVTKTEIKFLFDVTTASMYNETEKFIIKTEKSLMQNEKDLNISSAKKAAIAQKLAQWRKSKLVQWSTRPSTEILVELFAVLTILIQTRLPRVIISVLDEPMYKNCFGLEGFPLNDKKTNSLIAYLAHVLKYKFCKDSKETIEFLQTETQKLVSQYIEKNPKLQVELENAQARLLGLKTDIQYKQQEITGRYKLWQTFKPVQDISTFLSIDKQILPKAYKCLHDMYTSINDSSKTRPLGDKRQKQIHLNSCCLKPLDADDITNDVISNNNLILEKSPIKLLPKPEPVKYDMKQVQHTQNVKLVDIRQFSRKPYIDALNVNAYINNLATSNVLLSNDPVVASLVSAQDDKNSWKTFSNKLKEILDGLVQLTDNEVLRELQMLVLVENEDMHDFVLYVDMFHRFVANDLSKVMSRIGHDFTLTHLSYITNKKTQDPVDREIIKTLLEMSKTEVMVVEGAYSFMSDIARLMSTNMFAGIQGFVHQPLIQDSTSKDMFHLLLFDTYFFAKFCLVFLRATIDRVTKVEDFAFDIDVKAIDKDALPYKSRDVLKHITMCLQERKQMAYDSFTFSKETFEKQREKMKQNKIQAKADMDTDMKRYIKDLEKRGINVTILNIRNTNMDDVILDKSAGPAEDTQQQQEQQNERDKEVINDIINNKGYNDDNDDGDALEP